MLVIGHRGARGLAPENTLASLKKALEHGVQMVEFDVRVTKDGLPILSHNRTLKDASGNKISIAKSTYGELKSHKPDLATFEDALKVLVPRTKAYVEVKFWEPTAPIAKVIKKFLDAGGASENIFIASKSQKTLRELHKALPKVPIIVIEPWSGVRASLRARELGATRVSMNRLWLWSGFIRAFSHSGRELYAYTLNDPKKAAEWQHHGLAGVVTDYPDRFEK